MRGEKSRDLLAPLEERRMAPSIASATEGNPSTAPYRPWKLKGYIAFDTKEQALAFERYLKSGSGHAFRKRHLW